MRQTIYIMMEEELGEAIIDQPTEWLDWDQGQRSDWAANAKELRTNDLSLLEEWLLLIDTREETHVIQNL